ncbi:hypothetical protein MHB65_20055 [Lysinibacillus sp. FSL K6-0075]|uniref:hypothetical protein n=1 Tax=Lysinibacillus sp. FSL K6-0075 TaxID=2921415 RepID=UPI0031595BA0
MIPVAEDAIFKSIVVDKFVGNVFYNSKGEFIYVTLDKLIAIEENKVCLLNFHKVAQ